MNFDLLKITFMKQSNFNLYTVTAIALSVFAGGCLVVLLGFVPMWKQLQPAEFLQWFSENGKTIGVIMLPLEMIPFTLSVRSYLKLRKTQGSSRTMLLLANICNMIILAMFFMYFLPVNASFLDGSMPFEKVSEALNNWQYFHLNRTILSILAAIFGILAIAPAKQKVVLS